MKIILYSFLLIFISCNKKPDDIMLIELNRIESSLGKDEKMIFLSEPEKFAPEVFSDSKYYKYVGEIKHGDLIDSEIVRYFRSQGILEPEYMASIIFNSLHRKLNNKEIALQKQIDTIIECNRIFQKQDEELCDLMYSYCLKFKSGDTVNIRIPVNARLYSYPMPLFAIQSKGKSSRDIVYTIKINEISCSQQFPYVVVDILNHNNRITEKTNYLLEKNDVYKFYLTEILIE